MSEIVIRENVPRYMEELKAWLESQKNVPLEVDYLAACREEEELLMDFCRRKRKAEGIPEEVFVHFDTPLTAEHEMTLLRNGGFSTVKWLWAVEGASFLWCRK